MKGRKMIAALACSAALITSASAIDLVVDGSKLQLDVPPQVIDQRTMVPLRAIFESLDATVTWDQVTQTATAIKGTYEVKITLDSTTAYVNGQPQTLDVPATAIDGRTLVPVRFVSEALNADVEWIQESQTVRITTAACEGLPTPVPSATPTPAPTPAPTETPSTGHKIYVTKTGSKYHYDSSCNGGTYYESTLEEALARGLTPCAKCVGN